MAGGQPPRAAWVAVPRVCPWLRRQCCAELGTGVLYAGDCSLLPSPLFCHLQLSCEFATLDVSDAMGLVRALLRATASALVPGCMPATGTARSTAACPAESMLLHAAAAPARGLPAAATPAARCTPPLPACRSDSTSPRRCASSPSRRSWARWGRRWRTRSCTTPSTTRTTRCVCGVGVDVCVRRPSTRSARGAWVWAGGMPD